MTGNGKPKTSGKSWSSRKFSVTKTIRNAREETQNNRGERPIPSILNYDTGLRKITQMCAYCRANVPNPLRYAAENSHVCKILF